MGTNFPWKKKPIKKRTPINTKYSVKCKECQYLHEAHAFWCPHHVFNTK